RARLQLRGLQLRGLQLGELPLEVTERRDLGEEGLVGAPEGEVDLAGPFVGGGRGRGRRRVAVRARPTVLAREAVPAASRQGRGGYRRRRRSVRGSPPGGVPACVRVAAPLGTGVPGCIGSRG